MTTTTPAVETDWAIDVTSATHRYAGSKGSVSFTGIDLRVPIGQFVSIVGPSGCGKSTLLTVLSGLAALEEGSVSVAGQPVTGVRRDVGFILQRDALLPWKTVLDNVELPLKFRKLPKQQRRERALEVLHRVGMSDYAQRYPAQLSGGQRKRVAIAATLVYQPALLLMDEPFSALDVQTRDFIEADILRLWSETRTQTVLFVTHDLEEAIALSDRVIVMSAGPGRVVSDYPIDLPRPRDLLEVKLLDQFRDLQREIGHDLRAEVIRSADRH